VEIGAEEGRTMFAKDDDESGDEKDEENEIGAGIFKGGHGVSEFYMRVEWEGKLGQG
jgi:hypothetical protein